MYVMVVGNNLPTEKEPTLGQFAWDQARALKESGLNVVYMALDFRSFWHWRSWGFKKLERNGIPIYKTDLPIGFLPLSSQSAIGKKAFNKLYERAVAELGKPALIHAHFTDMGLISHEKANEEGVDIYLTEHSSKMNREVISKEDVDKALEIYPTLTTLITVSETLRKNIKDKLGFDSIVVPNVLDTSLFKYDNSKTSNNISDTFNFVATGNLISLKAFDILISAFEMHLKDYPDSRLKIFGKGPLRKELEELTEEKGIKDKIEFEGVRPRRILAEEYSKSHAFILLSYSETFGVAFIEAMASGLPVISSRSGGPEDFINSENGFFVDKGDTYGAYLAMNKMREEYSKFDREAISISSKEKFSPKGIAKRIRKIYEEKGSI